MADPAGGGRCPRLPLPVSRPERRRGGRRRLQAASTTMGRAWSAFNKSSACDTTPEARRNPSCIGTDGFRSIGAAANQFGQLLLELGSSRGGLGLQDLTAAELTDFPALSVCDAEAGRPS